MKLSEKPLDEQIKEAERFTSEEEASNKCYFAQTAYDHLVRCGTPPDPRMWDNPDTPLIDFMSDEEVEHSIEAFYKDLSPDNPYAIKFFEENIQYEIQTDSKFKSPLTKLLLFFEEVGRLPDRYSHLVKRE
jgi:hypothetical protein